MLQNISECWKLNKNLILNDFDKSYIMIVFASWHLLMDAASDSLQFFLVLFCDWFVGGRCVRFLLGIL